MGVSKFLIFLKESKVQKVTYAMTLTMPVKNGRLDDALALIGSAMDAIQGEKGCLAYEVCVIPGRSAIFMFEAYVDEDYHDNVHEMLPEVRNILNNIWDLIDGEVEITKLHGKFSRAGTTE